MSEGCYFCGEGGSVLEQHHIIPERMGGLDRDDNLVGLCPTCHRKLEQLYDDEFYQRIGADDKAKVEENPTPEEFTLAAEAALPTIYRMDQLEVGDPVSLIADEVGADVDLCPACRRPLIFTDNEERCGRCNIPVDGLSGVAVDE